MRYLLTVLISIATYSITIAQTYEIGGFLGGANYIGDVGETTYINPNTLAFGAIFKWNRSSRHSFRASFIHADIKANDKNSSEDRRKERGYKFENSINEISIGLEYTFWEFSMYSGRPASAPYLYTGLTFFTYDALYKKPTEDEISDYDQAGTFAIPMVLGYKTTLGRKLVLAFEIGARYTFTDDLDGSNPVNGLKNNDRVKFGNINNNDWYVFSGITLNYTFGRKPCYCNF